MLLQSFQYQWSVFLIKLHQNIAAQTGLEPVSSGFKAQWLYQFVYCALFINYIWIFIHNILLIKLNIQTNKTCTYNLLDPNEVLC